MRAALVCVCVASNDRTRGIESVWTAHTASTALITSFPVDVVLLHVWSTGHTATSWFEECMRLGRH